MTALMKRVLFATDFSACADRALGYALAVANVWKSELSVMTVLELYPGMDPDYTVNKMYLDHLRDDANRQLAVLEGKVKAAGQTMTSRIETGIPSQCVQTVAEEIGADLLVVGTHGRTGLDHVLVGSTAERVVRIAPCPVLAVKADKGAAPAAQSPTIKRIVVPIDLSTCSLDALEYAVQFAKPLGASITILHALEPVAYGLDFSLSHAKEWREQRAYLEKRLTVLTACVAAHGIQTDFALKPGLPADSIASYVTGQGYDLMVMGTHGRRGLSHVLVGSIAGAMLRYAPCPVLTVRRLTVGADYQRVVPLGES